MHSTTLGSSAAGTSIGKDYVKYICADLRYDLGTWRAEQNLSEPPFAYQCFYDYETLASLAFFTLMASPTVMEAAAMIPCRDGARLGTDVK